MLTITGEQIKVINAGLVSDEFPNIRNHAELEINGELLCGDVLFTETIREYYILKHHLNSRYNRCILHLASRDEFTNLRIRLQNCKSIPTLIGDIQDFQA